ncbi:hypothetical protein QBC44DRAFT_389233 [Cladorrhinum sp. PSN332]|nr:hypothetical protein QBC44DRAFT_389233 [Cladorrhinum sp. PSN332]
MAISKKKGQSSKSSRPKVAQAQAQHEPILPSIETTDLSAPPNWEFWEVEGFRFSSEEDRKLQPKLREVWSVLSRAQYTTLPPEDSDYRESKELIKLRVSNNLAVVAQCHIHFRSIYGTPCFLREVANAASLKADPDIIQLIMTVFTAARKAHVDHRESIRFEPLFSTLTDTVDQWLRFTKVFSSLSIPRQYAAQLKEASVTWKDHIDRGAMMNLAQRPRREGTAPTIPVIINGDSDVEVEPSLPTKRKRAATVTARQTKKRAVRTLTPLFSSSSPAREEFRPFRHPSQAPSTSSFALSSLDSGVGLLPSSPPIRMRLRARTSSPPPFTPSSQVTGFSDQPDSINASIASHQTTLTNHEKRLKKLETPARKKPAATATDITIQLAGQVLALEERINSKEQYVKRVAAEQFTLCKAGFDPLLKAANDRVNSLGEDLAIHKSSFSTDFNSLTSRVDKLEGIVPNINAGKGSNSRTTRSGAGSVSRATASRADDVSQTQQADDESSVIWQLRDLDKRVKYLEKQPSTRDLGTRLSAVESEVLALKERDQAREDEMNRLRRDVEEMRSRGGRMGHGDMARLPIRPGPPAGPPRNNNKGGNRYKYGNGNANFNGFNPRF